MYALTGRITREPKDTRGKKNHGHPLRPTQAHYGSYDKFLGAAFHKLPGNVLDSLS